MSSSFKDYPESPGTSRLLPVLFVLFAASGCSALIYEIVWYQLLQLAIGSTTVSLGILLATFMGGLSIGSAWLPRTRWMTRSPLRAYAAIEIGIAACGLLVLWGMPLVSALYFKGAASSGLAGMLLRGAVAALCMLAPTTLMGASLPVIVRAAPPGMASAGLLYGGNTVGAVFGCLLAGFSLLRLYDTAAATYVAAGLNAVVAAISILLSKKAYAKPGPEGFWAQGRHDRAARTLPVYVTIGLSGACALGAEVIWTRLLGMLLGATVYAFSIILAVFLIGLGAGSIGASLVLEKLRPRVALGWAQIFAAAGIAWTAYMIGGSLPYWPIDTMLARSPWHTFQLDMARCLWALLPATILWGASMPLALAAAAGRKNGEAGHDPGRPAGAVYAANTLGAIAGALLVSLVLVPAIGTRDSQLVLLGASELSALVVLLPYARRSKSSAVWTAASFTVLGLLGWSIPAIPGELIAYGRRLPVFIGNSKIVYTTEGRNSSVAIGQWPNGATEIDVNGHIEATTEPFDMKLQRMVGHLPALLHPNPKSVLGIGFGAGVSAGTFTRYPGIEKITICEIEPRIPPISTRYFALQNYEVFRNPKTRVVFDDARHYLMTTNDKFDIIASDPLDVFVKGTAALYSLEYFEAVKRHLNPGGMFTLYVPLYESDLRTVKSELATFFAAFPDSTVWANNRSGQGYDMVLMGQLEPVRINVNEVQARLSRPGYEAVAQSLLEVSVGSAVDLLSTYTGRTADLKEWTKGAPLNRDRDLRLMYLAGWGINSNMADQIYRDMLRHRRLPASVFEGSPETLRALEAAISYNSSGIP